jgi:hypothetical protein
MCGDSTDRSDGPRPAKEKKPGRLVLSVIRTSASGWEHRGLSAGLPEGAGSETEIEMKLYHIAAAALLVGTSAMAWQPKDAWLDSKDGQKVASAAWDGAKMAEADEFTVVKADFDTAESGAMPAAWSDLGTPKLIPASNVVWDDVDGPEPVLASTASWDDDLAKADSLKAEDESVETVAVEPMAGDPDLDLAVEPEEVAVDTGEPAIGGPLEETTTGDINMAAADLATRPATQNYPACRPGPGDDNCIQLYEPGVRTALASWNRPTGGLAGEAQTAMGGPYEPVDEASAEAAMNGDGDVDMAMGETEESETIGV